MLQDIKAKLASKKQLTHNVWLFNFSLENLEKLEFNPGQYLIMSAKNSSGETVKRLYSIASPPQEGSFELLVQLVPGGCASSYFSSLQIGDEVFFQGPAGVFFVKEEDRGDLVFLVTGTGLAPARSIINSLLQKEPNRFLHLLWGIPKKEDVYFLDDLKQLAQKYKNFDFKICLSREIDLSFVKEEDKKHFLIGHVCADFDELKTKENWDNLSFYLCGSREVVESVKTNLSSSGVPPDRIHFEKF